MTSDPPQRQKTAKSWGFFVLDMPADTRIKLNVIGLDLSSGEFGSDDFLVGKIVLSNAGIRCRCIGSYKHGRCGFIKIAAAHGAERVAGG